jgi:hypothetical protein
MPESQSASAWRLRLPQFRISALGMGESQELRQFFFGLEGVGGEVVHGADRLGAFRGQEILSGQAGPHRRVDVLCVECAHDGFPLVRRLPARPIIQGVWGATDPKSHSP